MIQGDKAQSRVRRTSEGRKNNDFVLFDSTHNTTRWRATFPLTPPRAPSDRRVTGAWRRNLYSWPRWADWFWLSNTFIAPLAAPAQTQLFPNTRLQLPQFQIAELAASRACLQGKAPAVRRMRSRRASQSCVACWTLLLAQGAISRAGASRHKKIGHVSTTVIRMLFRSPIFFANSYDSCCYSQICVWMRSQSGYNLRLLFVALIIRESLMSGLLSDDYQSATLQSCLLNCLQ